MNRTLLLEQNAENNKNPKGIYFWLRYSTIHKGKHWKNNRGIFISTDMKLSTESFGSYVTSWLVSNREESKLKYQSF